MSDNKKETSIKIGEGLLTEEELNSEDLFFKEVIPYISQHPGVLQAYLLKIFPNVRGWLYWSDKAGILRREPSGSSYKVYLLCGTDEKTLRSKFIQYQVKKLAEESLRYSREISYKVEGFELCRKKLKKFLGRRRLSNIEKEYRNKIGDPKMFLLRLGNGIICDFNEPLSSVFKSYWTEDCDAALKIHIEKYGFLSTRYFCDKKLPQILGKYRYKKFLNELMERWQEFEVLYCGWEPVTGLQADYLHYLYADSRRFQLKIKPWIEFKRCRKCGRYFVPIEVYPEKIDKYPDGTTVRDIGLCNNCLDFSSLSQKTRMSKKEMLERLKRLVEILGFIPRQDFLRNFEYLKRLSSIEQFEEAVCELVDLPPYQMRENFNPDQILTFKEAFGSWLNVLLEAGLLSEGSQKMSRGYKCLALDGHICLSLGEKIIDDFLYKQGIPHEKEVPYPLDEELNPQGLLRCDWKIKDVFVEFVGLKGNIEYDLRTKRKRQLAHKLSLKLFEISPDDLPNLESKIKQLQEIAGQ